MKISFQCLNLSFIAGNIGLLFLPYLLNQYSLIGLAVFALGCLWLGYRFTRWRVCLMIGALLLSLSYCVQRAEWALARRVPATAEGHYWLTGVIANIPTPTTGYSQAEVAVLTLTAIDTTAPTIPPRKLRLSWYNTARTPAATWKNGETWRLLIKLKPPRSTYNPASFDQEAWFLAHEIDGSGYVSNTNSALRVSQSPRWQNLIQQLRAHFIRRIEASCSGSEGCAQVQALTVGHRDAFTLKDWQLLQATGTNHLFAIAGLHIGFVAAAAFWFGKQAWRLIPRAPLWLAAPTFGGCFALLAACGYSTLAGFLLPTKRACIAMALLLIARLWHRRLPPWHAWSFALMAILAWQPLWILDSSVWLSFGTVALLIYVYAYRWPKPTRGWRGFIHLQAILSLGLWPLTAFFFGTMSMSSFIANCLAIPWVALTVLPWCLFAVLIDPLQPAVAGECWRLASFQLHLLKQGLRLLSQLPYSHFALSMTQPGLVLLSSIGIFILFAPKALPARGLGLVFCLTALLWPPISLAPQTIRLTLFDVGQGLSALIQTQHHALVFDTGSRLSEQVDMGERVVVPALKAAGIHRLDMLIISHGDNDHAGGAYSVWASLPINRGYTGDITQLTKSVPHFPWHACIAQTAWLWDDVHFQFLYPPANDLHAGNDHSCVLKVSNSTQQILLTGDIEKSSERYLLQNNAALLASTVLIAPHHGSKSSSTPAFVAAVKPQWVLFPTGYHNRFHFPHPSIIKRYQTLPAERYDTAIHGQIIVTLTPNMAPTVITTRQDKPPFWRIP